MIPKTMVSSHFRSILEAWGHPKIIENDTKTNSFNAISLDLSGQGFIKK